MCKRAALVASVGGPCRSAAVLANLCAAGPICTCIQSLLGHKTTHVTTHYSAADVSKLIAASEKVCDQRIARPAGRGLFKELSALG